jgi:hypothetical protein
VDGRIANPYTPNLRIRISSQKSLRRGQTVRVDLESTAIHVNRHNLSVIARFHLRAYFLFVNRRTETSVFFLTVPRLSFGHDVLPVAFLASVGLSHLSFANIQDGGLFCRAYVGLPQLICGLSAK